MHVDDDIPSEKPDPCDARNAADSPLSLSIRVRGECRVSCRRWPPDTVNPGKRGGARSPLALCLSAVAATLPNHLAGTGQAHFSVAPSSAVVAPALQNPSWGPSQHTPPLHFAGRTLQLDWRSLHLPCRRSSVPLRFLRLVAPSLSQIALPVAVLHSSWHSSWIIFGQQPIV